MEAMEQELGTHSFLKKKSEKSAFSGFFFCRMEVMEEEIGRNSEKSGFGKFCFYVEWRLKSRSEVEGQKVNVLVHLC